MTDFCNVLSSFISELQYDDIPQSTVENTRKFLLDYICAALAGKKVNRTFNRAIEDYIYSQCGTEESSSLFGTKKLPCGKAAFINACYAHGADMDDGNRKAMGHVGAHVFSTVLAIGEKLKSDEKDMIVAINVGYEVYCRMAAAAQPGLVHRGFHSTGTAGVIACAAASAKLMGLNEKQIYNSMAISVTMASGLMIVAESGQSIKPLNPAKAAECGILAAELAKNGVDGGVNPFESKKGWFHAMSESIDYQVIDEGLGKVFCIDECYIKPYPSCRHTHCGIQAALELREEYDLKPEDIENINVYIYSNAIRIAGQIKWPKTQDDSKFSICYSLACSLVYGRFSLNELDFNSVPESVRLLAEKIKLIADDSMENRDRGIRGCRVEIVCKNGNTFKNTVLIPKGDPQNPFTYEDIQSKFAQCADGVLEKDFQKKTTDKILKFGKEKHFEGIRLI